MTALSTVREPGIGTDAESSPVSSSGEFDILADLRKELEQLSAANRAIFEELRSDPVVDLGAPAARRANIPTTGDAEWAERQREYEALLEEKSETIRALNLKVQQLEEGIEPEPLDPAQLHDAKVKRVLAQLEVQRQQLEEDEQALMRQMREMELSLAKDRADLARQRSELLRLQADFQRELETASRDPDLSDRLASLRRRHQESQVKRTVEPGLPAPAFVAAPEAPRPKSSIIRRIFGRDS